MELREGLVRRLGVFAAVRVGRQLPQGRGVHRLDDDPVPEPSARPADVLRRPPRYGDEQSLRSCHLLAEEGLLSVLPLVEDGRPRDANWLRRFGPEEQGVERQHGQRREEGQADGRTVRSCCGEGPFTQLWYTTSYTLPV